MNAPTSAMAVANWFLKRAERDGVDLDQLKMYNLVYYAHAWHLGNDCGPLFEKDDETWPWAPS